MIGTKMDFAIPGRWISTNQSTDNDKVAADIIAVHHENENKPGYFLYSSLGDGKFSQIGNDDYKSIHESVLTHEYLYMGPLLAGGTKKPKIGNIESVKQQPIATATATPIAPVPVPPTIATATPINTNNYSEMVNSLEIKQKSFTELFVDKLITKNDGLKFNNTLQFKSIINLMQVHETIELMDIDVTEFVDSLFNNPEFMETIKAGIVESISYGNVSTDVVNVEVPESVITPPTVIEYQPDPRIDDLMVGLQDIKTMITDFNQNHWTNNLEEHKLSTEPPIILPLAETPTNDSTPNYSEMIKRFMNNDKQK